jgi:ribosomal-protein-alanine N-acetyltransferase
MTTITVQIRWILLLDMPDVLEIERESFEFSWTEDDFLCCLKQRNCSGMVAEHDGRIVGFMIYELHKSRLQILNFAVGVLFRRSTVGRQMIDRLITKLQQQRRKDIVLEVRESNLTAQLFFREHGFMSVHVLRHHYDDTAEDAYVMCYRLDRSEVSDSEPPPRNRIEGFV